MASSTTALSPNPLLFISHKHIDHEIAKVLADFIKQRTGAQVHIHVSSDPDYAGPAAGRHLNQQLKQTLWKTEALILIYTSADQSWSYCLWECGVATNPNSPDTNIIVFQCGDEAPPVYDGFLTVRGTNLNSVRGFVDQIFRGNNFFPNRPQPITNFSEKDCERFAAELHAKLVEVIGRQKQSEQWSPWPTLGVELPEESVAKLSKTMDSAQIKTLVSENAFVSQCHARVPAMFGLARIQEGSRFSDLIPNTIATSDWFDSCCLQIADSAAGREGVVRLVALSSPTQDASYTPVVTNMKRTYGKPKSEFEISFYNLSDPRGILVSTRMIPSAKLFSRELEQVRQQSLYHVSDEMDNSNVNRLPLLSDGAVEFVVHRSMIDQFLAKRSRQKPQPSEDPRLNELLTDPTFKPMFTAFCVVGQRTTLADARAKVNSIPNCRDLFVTQTGAENERVLGYLSNLELG